MFVRGFLVRVGFITVLAGLALFAFSYMSEGRAPSAHAAGNQPSCTFTTPIPQLIQQGGGSDTVTCTLTVHGTPHTLVVDFTLTLQARPPITIDGCILDGNPISIGPCP
jgi:hypothetical protein